MANESEKSDGITETTEDATSCPITEPLHQSLEELFARFTSELIVQGAETNLNDAMAHTMSHMMRWVLESVFALTGGDLKKTAEVMMRMIAKIAQDEGINVETHVIATTKSGEAETKH